MPALKSSLAELSFEPFHDTEIRCLNEPWPLIESHAKEIDAYWEARRKEKPSLFNGHTFVAKSVELSDGIVKADLYDTPYKALLYWRNHLSSDSTVRHLISVPLVVTADGALILGEMGPQNATSGMIYPPCGTFSLEDVLADGSIADRACAVRELKEETGLTCDDAIERGGTMVIAKRLVVVLRMCRLSQGTEEVREAINKFLDLEVSPELSAVHFVTRVGQIPSERTVPYVERFIQHLFGSSPHALDAP